MSIWPHLLPSRRYVIEAVQLPREIRVISRW